MHANLIKLTAAVALSLPVAALTDAQQSASATEGAAQGFAAQIPAPFAGWHVTVRPTAPGTVEVAFDSVAMKQRVTNTVFLPANRTTTRKPLPVLYYLHGTVAGPAQSESLAPLTSQEFFLDMISQGGGDKQTRLFDFASQSRRADFIVVAPDTDPVKSACTTCFWQNAGPEPVGPLDPPPVQAETFMLDELQPLIETLFHTRTDRGGRGIMGFSMGGWAALLYGVHHPDLYTFVASVSGVVETRPERAAPAAAALEAVGYLRSQGYGSLPTRNPAYNAMFNPAGLASNLLGWGVTLFFSTGDGCVTARGAPDCAAHPTALNPAGSGAELLIRSTNEPGQRAFARAGVRFTSVESPGIHGSNNRTVYGRDIVPLANTAFSRNPRLQPYQLRPEPPNIHSSPPMVEG